MKEVDRITEKFSCDVVIQDWTCVRSVVTGETASIDTFVGDAHNKRWMCKSTENKCLAMKLTKDDKETNLSKQQKNSW